LRVGVVGGSAGEGDANVPNRATLLGAPLVSGLVIGSISGSVGA
jgi:hypothetical protein